LLPSARCTRIRFGLTGRTFLSRSLWRGRGCCSGAFSELEIEPIEQIESGDRFVLVFFQRGRHAGPFETPLGSLAPTGRTFEIRVIDVLTISDGRIGAIEVVPDNLSLMTQLDAVRLAK
jgi:hypothetical protein